MIKYPSNVDFSKFKLPDDKISDDHVKYGLPKKILFCKKCVESNQRPSTTQELKNKPGMVKETIKFNSENICSACEVSEGKLKTDWNLREKELKDLLNGHRKTDGSYDCIVPGSGGKDSIYVSNELKNKYGMHPLTVTWAPHIYTNWGKKNHDKWIDSGQDNILVTPNGLVHRLFTRLALETLFHPFQPFILGQKSIGPRIAAAMNIKLIFYGEHEAEYGSPIEQISSPNLESKYFMTDDLENLYISGLPIENLIQNYGIQKSELLLYLPLNKNLEKKIDVHYYGYYKKWHPQGAYYYAVENADFEASPERTSGTYSKYSSIDDKMDDLHYYTTGIKFGRGRATEDAAQEIRSGEITRKEGISLVKKFDLEYPKRFELELFDYLSISEKKFPVASKMFENPIMDKEYFQKLCNKFRSPHLWKLDGNQFKLRKTVWEET